MPIISPNIFRSEDLTINAEIQAVVNGRQYDMTGRRYFYTRLFGAAEEDVNISGRFSDGAEVTSTYNFRQNIGFGITNIDIDISTSLQPIIEITFKDLYGNTVFGGNNPENIDYSVLFDWPPPKFLFSYKGYLGKQVSYMLSIKKIDTNFVAQDGSYDIKVTFVPHQWGFFADIPFEFLKAVKTLKANANSATKQNVSGKAGYSIVDLTEVGFEIKQNYKNISSDYDEIMSKMIDYKTNIVLAVQRGFDEVDGRVQNGKEIPGFIPVKINKPKDFDSLSEDADGLPLYLYSRFYANGSPVNENYSSQTRAQLNGLSDKERAAIANNALKVINSNINAIQSQIQREGLRQNKDKIRKLTISEVFNQIASDTAYLMGRILEAAYTGMSDPEGNEQDVTFNRKQERKDALNKRLISGRGYPVVISGEGRDELPATQANFGTDLGVENPGCELAFVREFIKALQKGIANVEEKRDLINDVQSGEILARINNLETIGLNPYDIQSYDTFAQNIMARGAIAAWFTRSENPNKPGGFGNAFSESLVSWFDSSSKVAIALAEHDFKNINDTILAKFSESDLLKLKKFCSFWNKLITQEGDDLLTYNGQTLKSQTNSNLPFIVNLSISALGFFFGDSEQVSESIEFEDLLNNTPGEASEKFEAILSWLVVLNQGTSDTALQNATTPEEVREIISQDEEAEAITVRQMLQPLLGKGSLASIDPFLMSGNRFSNNGKLYIKSGIGGDTFSSSEKEVDFYIVFTGDDAEAVRSSSSAPNGSSDGVIYIDGIFDENGEVFDSIEEFNELVKNGQIYNHDSLKELNVNSLDFDSLDEQETIQLIKWTRLIGEENLTVDVGIEPSEEQGVTTDNLYTASELSNRPIAYMPFYAQLSNPLNPLSADYKRVAFDLWSNTDESQGQRAYIKKFCTLLLEKIQQKERDEQAKLNQLFRNQDGEEVIYRQFKALYEQWSTLATSNEVKSGKLVSQNVEEFRGLAERMMIEYGGYGTTNDSQQKSGVRLIDNTLPSVGGTEGVFVYDFPLQRIIGNSSTDNQDLLDIDVRESIINIDPIFESNSRTTVLNMFQSLAQKNNFMFIPIPGYANYLDVKDIYSPTAFNEDQKIINFFHVIFIPTPESDVIKRNGETFSSPLEFSTLQEQFAVDALEVKYGSTDNNIIKNINVSTQDNKVTAESAINIQRLVDSENTNKTVTRDCSILNVFAGRSYTANIDIIGNAQVFPMQFFFVRNLPIFDGLYQILKVKHSISPNNFETSFEGIKMRFSSGKYGGIRPITIRSLEEEYAVGPSSYISRQGVNPPSNEFNLPFTNSAGEASVVPYAAPDENNVTIPLQPGISLIKEFENLELEAYPDPASADGLPITIGWGTTIKPDGSRIQLGETITSVQAEEFLRNDIDKRFLPTLERTIPFWTEMDNYQKGALLSFSYNLGANFYGANNFETITANLKNKDWSQVPITFELYRNPGSNVEAGLLRRRQAEGAVWSKNIPKVRQLIANSGPLNNYLSSNNLV